MLNMYGKLKTSNSKKYNAMLDLARFLCDHLRRQPEFRYIPNELMCGICDAIERGLISHALLQQDEITRMWEEKKNVTD